VRVLHAHTHQRKWQTHTASTHAHVRTYWRDKHTLARGSDRRCGWHRRLRVYIWNESRRDEILYCWTKSDLQGQRAGRKVSSKHALAVPCIAVRQTHEAGHSTSEKFKNKVGALTKIIVYANSNTFIIHSSVKSRHEDAHSITLQTKFKFGGSVRNISSSRRQGQYCSTGYLTIVS